MLTGPNDRPPAEPTSAGPATLSFAGGNATASFVGDAPSTVAERALATQLARIGAPSTLPEMLGPYEIIQELGRGGMGVVLLAIDVRTRSKVAVKLLSKRQQASSLGRFRREFRAMQQLIHPHVIRVLEGSFEGETPYFAMEFVEGVTLRQHAAAHWAEVAGLGSVAQVREILELTSQIVEALGYIHSCRLVHRDFKPDNVMVDASGSVKLMDFGLAKSMDPVSLAQTSEGVILGTLAYMAPEQILGHADLDGRTDFYALGISLYQLMTGCLPFQGEVAALLHQHLQGKPRPPRELAPWLPPELESLILRLMSREVQARPSNAKELLASLGALLYQGKAAVGSALTEVTELLVPAFVGHDSLAEWLDLRLSEADRSEAGARLVMVSARAGLGKSRFLDAVADWGRQQLLPVARAGCRPEQRSPFSAVAPLLAAAQKQVGWLSDEDRELMRPLVALVPELEELLGSGDEVSAENAIPAGLAFLEAALQYQPLIFLLDDLHWADELSLDFLQRLARHGLPLRLLVLSTYRPEAVSEEHPVARLLSGASDGPLPCLRHELEALSPEAAAGLVGSALGADPGAIAPELLAAVLDPAQGSPLAILQELKELILKRRVHRAGDRFVLAGGGARPAPAPDQSTQMLTLESGPLPEARDLEKAILEAVAVFGRGLSMEILLGLIEIEETALLDALNRLLQRRVLRSVSGSTETFEIAQEAIRESVYQEIEAGRRQSLHGKAALALEWQGASPEVLAFHYRAAGELESALKYLLQATDRALQLYAYRDAIRLTEEALALLENQHSSELRCLFDDKFLNRQASSWYHLEELKKALLSAQRCLEAARRRGEPQPLLAAENSLGIICKDLMRLDEARPHYENALALAKQLGQRNLEAFVSNNLALLKLVEGSGREQLEKAVVFAQELDELPMKVLALQNLAELELHEGQLARCCEILGQAEYLAFRLEMKAQTLISKLLESIVLKIQGQWRDAEQGWCKTLEEGHKTFEMYWLQRAVLELSELEVDRGRLQKADIWLLDLESKLQSPTLELRRQRIEIKMLAGQCKWGLALQKIRTLSMDAEVAVQCLARFLEAQIFGMTGRLREAFSSFEQVEGHCESLQMGSLIWVVRFNRMLLQLETARAPQSLLAPLESLIQEAEQRGLQMWVHLLKLRWLGAKGDPDSDAWQQAFDFFRKQEAEADLGRGILLQAETLLNRRQESEAAKLLAEHSAWIQELGLPWLELTLCSLLSATERSPAGAEAAARGLESLRSQVESFDEKDREPFLAHPSVQRIRSRLGRRR